MTTTDDQQATRPLLGLLLRVKLRALSNRFRQSIDESPVRVYVAAALVVLIWFGLYWVFRMVFSQFDRTPLAATVAIPMVLNFFFVAILLMLTFSNAIIAYGALFGREESDYLLTAPPCTLDIVTLKYLESVALSSWSLVLLGMPLMVVMAERAEGAEFYVLFMAFFLAFIPIPGALGLFLAWLAARFFPRRLMGTMAAIGGVVLAGCVIWGMRSFRVDTAAEVWLRSFLARMSFVESAFLPNNWAASGIDHAMSGQLSESVLYLGVTLANAFFLSWLAVMFVAKYFDAAHDRASVGVTGMRRCAATAGGGIAGTVFFYLPKPLRLIAAKDLRTFVRDPMQWSQLAILVGLMVLYLANIPAFQIEFATSGWLRMIPFLNLCATSLILATFTCRFVFPLMSLEGRQLWLIGMLPTPRGHILLAKFAFAMTVTLIVALGAMSLATVMLKLDAVWSIIHLMITVAICCGLCGFAVGIGARLPMFDQSNVARIANGPGGTTSLLASIVLVAAVLTAVGVATWQSKDLPVNVIPDTGSVLLCVGAGVGSVAAGVIALAVGAKHFATVEV